MSEIEIRQVNIFSGDYGAKASITFSIGPLVVRGARIMSKEGKLWLAMPSKQMANGNWIHMVSITSQEEKLHLEEAALNAYREQLNSRSENEGATAASRDFCASDSAAGASESSAYASENDAGASENDAYASDSDACSYDSEECSSKSLERLAV